LAGKMLTGGREKRKMLKKKGGKTKDKGGTVEA
jgi:hypothetical protein